MSQVPAVPLPISPLTLANRPTNSPDEPERKIPRPRTAEHDQLLQQDLLQRNDLASNVLLLLRHTGMRIGECVDLSCDCLHAGVPGEWAIHVPLGKMKTERMVPVDSFVCQLVQRLRFRRSLDPAPADGFLLARPRGPAPTRCLVWVRPSPPNQARRPTGAGIVAWGEMLDGDAKACAAGAPEVGRYLVGQDPCRVVFHWQAIHRGAFYRGGPIKTAISSGINQALWDIKGSRRSKTGTAAS